MTHRAHAQYILNQAVGRWASKVGIVDRIAKVLAHIETLPDAGHRQNMLDLLTLNTCTAFDTSVVPTALLEKMVDECCKESEAV